MHTCMNRTWPWPSNRVIGYPLWNGYPITLCYVRYTNNKSHTSKLRLLKLNTQVPMLMNSPPIFIYSWVLSSLMAVFTIKLNTALFNIVTSSNLIHNNGLRESASHILLYIILLYFMNSLIPHEADKYFKSKIHFPRLFASSSNFQYKRKYFTKAHSKSNLYHCMSTRELILYGCYIHIYCIVILYVLYQWIQST